MSANPAARALARDSYRVRLTGRLDRHEAEELQVELRALAKRHGLAVGNISVRRVPDERSA